MPQWGGGGGGGMWDEQSPHIEPILPALRCEHARAHRRCGAQACHRNALPLALEGCPGRFHRVASIAQPHAPDHKHGCK